MNSIFWVSGYNTQNKSKIGNLIFGDDIHTVYIWFGNLEFSHCHTLAMVVFQVKVVSVLELAVCAGLVKLRPLRYTSSVYADSLWCHFGKKVSCLFDFHRPLPCVFLSQPSDVYAQEIQLPTFYLVRLHSEVYWSSFVFSLLYLATILLWPFWPYSSQGTWHTVQAVPGLLALP